MGGAPPHNPDYGMYVTRVFIIIPGVLLLKRTLSIFARPSKICCPINTVLITTKYANFSPVKMNPNLCESASHAAHLNLQNNLPAESCIFVLQVGKLRFWEVK